MTARHRHPRPRGPQGRNVGNSRLLPSQRGTMCNLVTLLRKLHNLPALGVCMKLSKMWQIGLQRRADSGPFRMETVSAVVPETARRSLTRDPLSGETRNGPQGLREVCSWRRRLTGILLPLQSLPAHPPAGLLPPPPNQPHPSLGSHYPWLLTGHLSWPWPWQTAGRKAPSRANGHEGPVPRVRGPRGP